MKLHRIAFLARDIGAGPEQVPFQHLIGDARRAASLHFREPVAGDVHAEQLPDATTFAALEEHLGADRTLQLSMIVDPSAAAFDDTITAGDGLLTFDEDKLTATNNAVGGSVHKKHVPRGYRGRGVGGGPEFVFQGALEHNFVFRNKISVQTWEHKFVYGN